MSNDAAPLASFIRAAFNSVAANGFVKTRDDNGDRAGNSTYNDVVARLAAAGEAEVAVEGNAQDFERVESEIGLLADKFHGGDFLSEFDAKVAKVLASGKVGQGDMALVAAAVGVAYKRLKREDAVVADPTLALPSAHFGVVGKRAEFDLLVERVKSYESQYGGGLIIAGRRAGSNDKFVWFASGDARFLGDAKGNGKVVKVTATVKNHEDGRFGKQTVLNRVALYVSPADKKVAKAAAVAAQKAAQEAYEKKQAADEAAREQAKAAYAMLQASQAAEVALARDVTHPLSAAARARVNARWDAEAAQCAKSMHHDNWASVPIRKIGEDGKDCTAGSH